jgi:cyclophilin family peptidyl-prolyl cis-trans isomerase
MRRTGTLLFLILLLSALTALLPRVDAKGGSDKEATADPIVVIKTSKGDIKIKVFKNEAPITGENFLDLVQKHFYDGQIFWRYEPGFCIQGGDPKGDGTGGYVDKSTGEMRCVKLEKIPGLRHDASGIVGLARREDPDSGSSQFYITLAPVTFLDDPPGYAVFGKVVDGLDTVFELRKGDKMVNVSVEEDKKGRGLHI